MSLVDKDAFFPGIALQYYFDGNGKVVFGLVSTIFENETIKYEYSIVKNGLGEKDTQNPKKYLYLYKDSTCDTMEDRSKKDSRFPYICIEKDWIKREWKREFAYIFFPSRKCYNLIRIIPKTGESDREVKFCSSQILQYHFDGNGKVVFGEVCPYSGTEYWKYEYSVVKKGLGEEDSENPKEYLYLYKDSSRETMEGHTREHKISHNKECS